MCQLVVAVDVNATLGGQQVEGCEFQIAQRLDGPTVATIGIDK